MPPPVEAFEQPPGFSSGPILVAITHGVNP